MKDDGQMLEQEQDFFKISREQELACFKIFFNTLSNEAAPTSFPPLIMASNGDINCVSILVPLIMISNKDVALYDFFYTHQDGLQEDNNNVEVLHTKNVKPFLNAWVKDVSIKL